MKPMVILQNQSTFRPEFEAIKDKALNKAKLGFCKAAAYLEIPAALAAPTTSKSIEAVSLNFLKTSKECGFYNLKFHHRDTEVTKELRCVLCAPVV